MTVLTLRKSSQLRVSLKRSGFSGEDENLKDPTEPLRQSRETNTEQFTSHAVSIMRSLKQ
jgi:hypothetical protein